eukprot:150755-Rhodomonas_salina.1
MRSQCSRRSTVKPATHTHTHTQTHTHTRTQTQTGWLSERARDRHESAHAWAHGLSHAHSRAAQTHHLCSPTRASLEHAASLARTLLLAHARNARGARKSGEGLSGG